MYGRREKVHFIWEKQIIQALWKEYENSYLIVVANPSPDMEEKYTNRMIISKKHVKPQNSIVDKTRTTKK